MAKESDFWSAVWAGPEHPGGTHPSCPEPRGAATKRELQRCFRDVQNALRDGHLDKSKVAVVTHPDRLDIWYLRFSNISCEEWSGSEIVAWIVFDYVPDRGAGKDKPLATFPDHPPLFGVLTPTCLFTELTGSKWLCLPGLAQGFGSEAAAWRTAFHGVADPSPRYNFDVKNTHVHVQGVGGHFKRGGCLPNLGGSMVRYVQNLLSQFEAGAAGWFDAQSEGRIDGITSKLDPDAFNVAQASSHDWNRRYLGPLMDEFASQGFAPSQPPSQEQQQRRLPALQQLQLQQQQRKQQRQQRKLQHLPAVPSPESSRAPRARIYGEPKTEAKVKTEAKMPGDAVVKEEAGVKEEAPPMPARTAVKIESEAVEEKPLPKRAAAEMAPRRRRDKQPRGDSNNMLGRRVAVMWNDGEWFAGTVVEYAAASDEHLIKYDDGDQKAHKLGEEESAGQLRWL